MKPVNVVVGTPIYRQGAYIIDKFLSNHKDIQQNYPSSELVLATIEGDFIEELEQLLSFWGLSGKVIRYQTAKPEYARHWIWNVACGREAIRQYTLSQTEASYLLLLDADMTCDPSVIKTMLREIRGYDVVFCGYAGRHYGVCLGIGCSMLTRGTLERVKFRCREFKNGKMIGEGEMLEMDLIGLGSRVKKGFFLSVCHYYNENEARCVTPQPLGLFRRIANSSFVRYGLIRASLVARRDIALKLQFSLYRLSKVMSSLPLLGRRYKKTG